MSSDFHQIIITGRCGRDPETRFTSQGVAVCDFSIAVSKQRGSGADRQEETLWFKCTAWRERAETASQYIKKGMKLMVIGEVKASAYMDKNGKPAASLEIVVSEFKFLDSKNDGDNRGGNTSNNSGRNQRQNNSYRPDDTNDIPF